MAEPVTLPDFPWDTLAPYADKARAHPGGIVDLSVGTPVDPTPAVVQRALASAADAPGYPLTWGSPALREAVARWFERRRGVPGIDPDGVLPSIGSKELVAWLPTLLGLGPGDRVAFPAVAYPTYDVGVRLARAEPVPFTGLTELGPMTSATAPKLIWVNSPSNPTGLVLGADHLTKVVQFARRIGAIVASDECYAELDWRTPLEGGPREPDGPTGVPSLLDPRVCGGDPENLLVLYSLSKQSNLAGYRAAFMAGDTDLVGRVLQVRKHAGMMTPFPVQQAMVAALNDDEHVAQQRARYARRREVLLAAFTDARFVLADSQAGLYLWLTRGEDCWESVAALAQRGILVAPGSFYGTRSGQYIRVALTATDERVDQVAGRLEGL